MKKKIIYIVLVIVTAFFAYRVYNLVKDKYFASTGNNRRNQATAVYAENIPLGSISDIIELNGDLKALYSYKLKAEVSGTLNKINCELGDQIDEAKTAAFIDDHEYILRSREAEAQLNVKQAKYNQQNSKKKNAEADFQRAQSLHSQSFISDSEFEEAEYDYNTFIADYHTAGAELAAAQAQFDLAQTDLHKTKLRVNKKGIVAEKFYDIGSYISAGSSVFTIVNIDTIIVRTSISEKDYPKVNRGQSVEIHIDAMPQRKFTGYISAIAPVLNTETRMANLEIKIENKDKSLKPGMYCTIRIYAEEKSNVPLIPNNVIVKVNDVSGVYSVDEKEMKAIFVPVKLGIISEKYSELLSPVINNKIITFGQFQIKKGSSVKITNENGGK